MIHNLNYIDEDLHAPPPPMENEKLTGQQGQQPIVNFLDRVFVASINSLDNLALVGQKE